MHVYKIKFVHVTFDWDCEFTFPAPDARKAREWAKAKLAGNAQGWICMGARRVKA